MALIDVAVTELSSDLKIQNTTVAYNEVQFGWQRNKRLMQSIKRVRLGLQTSPENFFYDETAFAGAPYVNLRALEFTMLTGTAEAGVYDNANLPVNGVELWSVTTGESDGVGGLVAGSEVARSALKINPELIEQVEVREGDTYTICVNGVETPTTVHQIHLSLKSSNKPDFTFYEFHPQPKYRFNRECNLLTDTLDPTLSVAYMGDNNYVLSPAQFAATLTVVEDL